MGSAEKAFLYLVVGLILAGVFGSESKRRSGSPILGSIIGSLFLVAGIWFAFGELLK